MNNTCSNNQRGRDPLYRSRKGIFLGVCSGLARHLNMDVFWIRFTAVIAFFITGLWPLTGIYLLTAFLMKPEPVVPFKSPNDREFYDSYTNSHRLATERLKRTYDNIERRIRRMEDIVTAKDFNWNERLRNNK